MQHRGARGCRRVAGGVPWVAAPSDGKGAHPGVDAELGAHHEIGVGVAWPAATTLAAKHNGQLPRLGYGGGWVDTWVGG